MKDYKNIINLNMYNIGTKLIDGYNLDVQQVEGVLLTYLYLIVLLINNDNYLERYNNLLNCTEELRKIEFLNNDSNYVVGVHNKKIIKNIRNAFAHGSGRIMILEDDLIISNDTRPNKDDNRNTTVKIKKADLIALLDKVYSSIDSNNNNISFCMDVINSIKNKESIHSKKLGYIILLTLIFSYNKESLYDKYMNFADSSLDLSNLDISDTRLLDDESQFNIKTYYEDNKMIFKSIEDELLYCKEKVDMAKNGYFIEVTDSQNKVVWDPKIMSKDKDIGIHIPNKLILLHLRNSVSHGLMEFVDNGIKFNDYNNKNGNYFNIMISYDQLEKLFISNYFKEGVNTLTNTHQTMKENMYRTQVALSRNSIFDFISFYRSKFSDKTEKEVIDYMIENNKFSTYLFENPNGLSDFLNVAVLENRIPLIEYISNYYNENLADLLKESPNLWHNNTTAGINGLIDYIKGNDTSFLLSKLIFLKNKYSYASIEEIKNSISESEIEELHYNSRLVTLYNLGNNDFYEELIFGNYLNNTSEIERIMCAFTHYDEYYLKNYDKKIEMKIDDIEHVYENSTEYKNSNRVMNYFKKNEGKTKRTLNKIMFKQKMYNFLKERCSKENTNKLLNLYDKMFLSKKHDRIMYLYYAMLVKEKENENKKNNI